MPLSPVAVQRDQVQGDLWARTAAAAGHLNRAHAQLVDIAVELIEGKHWGDGGFRSPEHYFVVRAGLSPAHARDVVVVARRRAELPDAAAAVSAGELSLDAAAVVAHQVPASYQASMTHLARHATVPQLRRVVSRHAFHDPGADRAAGRAEEAGGSTGVAVAPDPSSPVDPFSSGAFASESERRACAKPELAMHFDRDGRFQLRYSAPATIGALVEQSLREAKDALFLQQQGNDPDDPDDADASTGRALHPVHARGDGQRPSYADALTDGGHRPSYADALAEVAHRSLAGIASTSRASHYRVYLHLDTRGAWVSNRGAIPARLMARFLTDGVLQPVWETEGRPVSVGRSMRILPARSRRLIEDRDRGCRFPGCTATRFVEIHHLQEWSQGGATDVDNQISLCPFHHDAVGRGDVTLSGDPTRPDGLVVVNRFGHPLRPPPPQALASPDAERAADTLEPPDPATYRPPTGEPARWSEIDVLSDRELQDTFTPRLRAVAAVLAGGTTRPAGAAAVVERDPFDAYRRWDESG